MHAKHPATLKATPHDKRLSCQNVITNQLGILRNLKCQAKEKEHDLTPNGE